MFKAESQSVPAPSSAPSLVFPIFISGTTTYPIVQAKILDDIPDSSLSLTPFSSKQLSVNIASSALIICQWSIFILVLKMKTLDPTEVNKLAQYYKGEVKRRNQTWHVLSSH